MAGSAARFNHHLTRRTAHRKEVVGAVGSTVRCKTSVAGKVAGSKATNKRQPTGRQATASVCPTTACNGHPAALCGGRRVSVRANAQNPSIIRWRAARPPARPTRRAECRLKNPSVAPPAEGGVVVGPRCTDCNNGPRPNAASRAVSAGYVHVIEMCPWQERLTVRRTNKIMS